MPSHKLRRAVPGRVRKCHYRQARQVALNVFGQLFHGGVTTSRLFAKGKEHDIVEVAAKAAAANRVGSSARFFRLALANRLFDLRRRFAAELVWFVTGEQLVKQHP